MQAIRKKFTISDKQQPSCVVYALYILIATAYSSVKCHNRCHSTIDFLCGFFLVRLDVACRVGADEDVVHHPAKCFHEIVVSTKQVAEKFLPPAVLLFIFIGFVFNDVTADVVYRIADKIENDFPYVINDEAIYRYKKGVCNDVSNK